MITKDEIQELLHSTETYRVERTVSTGDMDKFQEAICAFANDLPNSRKKGYLILGLTTMAVMLSEKLSENLAVKMAVKKRTLEREIANMKQKGYISRTGSPRSGHWEVNIPLNCIIEVV